MSRKEEPAPPQVIYAVPPSVDAETWAEVEKKRIESENEKTTKIIELAREIADKFEKYQSAKISRVVLLSYLVIGGIIIGSTILTWIGKVGGETYAFLMGTVIGYIISILSE
jgi:F0F1-type ATP synthase assembly protein I